MVYHKYDINCIPLNNMCFGYLIIINQIAVNTKNIIGRINMELNIIKRNAPLSEQAFKIIKSAITSNELKPGEVLTEENYLKNCQ